MIAAPGEVTQLLFEWRQGNKDAEEHLIELVYRDLRRIASRYLRHEAPDHSLQPTALVHEAFLRLIDIKAIDWQSSSHFFAVSATMMRRILVDHARAGHATKRGNGWTVDDLENATLPSVQRAPEVLALDDALNRLAELDERQSKIVEMRFFAGMTGEESAIVLGISPSTVKREWRLAKAWLYKELS